MSKFGYVNLAGDKFGEEEVTSLAEIGVFEV